MTKQELLSTYTAEQLADKVTELERELNISRNLQNEVLFEERIAENIRKTTGMNINDVRKILQDTKKYMNDKYVKELQSEVDKYRKAFEDAKKERDCQIAEYQKKIEELQNQLDRSQTAINQIDEVLKEFFGATFEICETKDDFDGYRKFLEKRIKEKTVTDFFPTEPIKVADMLINSEGEYEHNPLVKKICGTDKGTYRIFGVSELRQIAEHLLVYCNHNGETEE